MPLWMGRAATGATSMQTQAGKDMLAGNTEFSRASSEVGGAIMQLRKEMGGAKAPAAPQSVATKLPRPAVGTVSSKPSVAPKAAPKPAAPASSEGDWEAF